MPNRGCKWDNGILWSTVTNAAVNRIIRAKCWFGTHFTTGFQLWSPMFINSDELQCKKTHWRFNWKWKLRVRVSVEEDRVGGNRKFIVSSFFFFDVVVAFTICVSTFHPLALIFAVSSIISERLGQRLTFPPPLRLCSFWAGYQVWSRPRPDCLKFISGRWCDSTLNVRKARRKHAQPKSSVLSHQQIVCTIITVHYNAVYRYLVTGYVAQETPSVRLTRRQLLQLFRHALRKHFSNRLSSVETPDYHFFSYCYHRNMFLQFAYLHKP